MPNQVGPIQTRIIVDAALLSGQSAEVRVVGRNDQLTTLRSCLAPMIEGLPPLNVWLYGRPGSGKTLLARQAAGEAPAGGAAGMVIYVDCWQHRSLYSVLKAIIDELKILRAEAQDTQIKLDRVRQVLRGRPAIIILDDIDRLMPAQGEQIIAGLLTLPKTGLICTATGTAGLARLETRVRSRLSPALVDLPAYSQQELELILADRAETCLAPDSWTMSTLRHIARGADGDARRAVQVFRQAAAAAEKSGRPRLDSRAIDTMVWQWQAIDLESRLADLSDHERIIGDLARQRGPIGTTALAKLHLEYCARHGLQPVARRTVAKYLSRLAAAGVVRFVGPASATGGRVVQAAMARTPAGPGSVQLRRPAHQCVAGVAEGV